MRRKKEKTN